MRVRYTCGATITNDVVCAKSKTEYIHPPRLVRLGPELRDEGYGRTAEILHRLRCYRDDA